MKNPWNEIPLGDYESHMSLDSVHQLQALNEIMYGQLNDSPAESVMILGVAGGNGIEHIGEEVKTVYGVDINNEYLTECKKRHPELAGRLRTICADLATQAAVLPHAQLLIANLLIEYIGIEKFAEAVSAVEPQRVSCVIQVNGDEGFVSNSPYLHVFDRLKEVHFETGEAALTEAMTAIGYSPELRSEQALPNGKKLLRLDYVK